MTQSIPITKSDRYTSAEMKAMANLQALGRDLVTQFYICLKTAAFYDNNNTNYQKQLQKFSDLVDIALEKQAEFRLTSVEGYLFLNEQRLKINLDGYLSAKSLQKTFDRFKITGLIFKNGVDQLSLSFLITELVRNTNITIGAEELNKLFNSKNVSDIEFIPSLTISSEEDITPKDERKKAKRVFFNAINVVQDILTTPADNRQLNLIRAKRAIHSLVDQLLKNERYLLELTALQKFDDYTYKHSVNVSIFSVALGLRLGFSKAQLSELGFAALFHDFGKTKIPLDLLNKPDGLNSSDWSQMQEHPVYGAKVIAQNFLMERYTARAILVAFEHHKNLDGTGYPYINRTCSLNLYSQIVSICDYFDALTSGRTYRKKSVPVDEVILQMMKLSNVKFDAHLLKVMINLVGIYPSGSLLLLDTGELALVTANNANDIFRPEVKIIADTRGKKNPPIRTHLSAFDSRQNRYFRNVLHLVDPTKYDIDISEYILSD